MELLQTIAIMCQLHTGHPDYVQLKQTRCQQYYVKCVDRKSNQKAILKSTLPKKNIDLILLKQCLKDL